MDTTERHHLCIICDKSFSTISNLFAHLRNIHKEQPVSAYRASKCALCSFEFQRASLYHEHLRSNHDVTVSVQQLEFSKESGNLKVASDHSDDNGIISFISAFQEWLRTTMATTHTQFVKSAHKKETTAYKLCYYNCNRTGVLKSQVINKKKSLRSQKKQGSRRINGTCPARVRVAYVGESNLEVAYCGTHVGHSCDLMHIDMTKDERDWLASMLTAGIPKSEIIARCRHNAPANFLRVKLVTFKDLWNVEKSYKLPIQRVTRPSVKGRRRKRQACDEDLRHRETNSVELLKLPNDQVELVIGGEVITASKALLISKSTVFAAMFEANEWMMGSNKLVISDVEYSVMLELICGLYTNSICCSNNVDFGIKLMAAAFKCDISSIKQQAEAFLVTKLCETNCLEMITVADANQAHILKSAAIEYATKLAATCDVTELTGYHQLTSENVKLLIQSMCSQTKNLADQLKSGALLITPPIVATMVTTPSLPREEQPNYDFAEPQPTFQTKMPFSIMSSSNNESNLTVLRPIQFDDQTLDQNQISNVNDIP